MSSPYSDIGGMNETFREWFYGIGKRCRLTIVADGVQTTYEGLLQKVNPTCTIARVKIDDVGARDIPIDLVTEKRLSIR